MDSKQYRCSKTNYQIWRFNSLTEWYIYQYIKFFEGIVEYKNKNFKTAVDIFSKVNLDKRDLSRNALKTNYLAKSYDSLGMYQEAYKFFEISNKISEELPQNNSNKKTFMDSILKRI